MHEPRVARSSAGIDAGPDCSRQGGERNDATPAGFRPDDAARPRALCQYAGSNDEEVGRCRTSGISRIKADSKDFHVLVGDFNTLAPGELLNMQKLPMRYRLLAMLLGGRITYRTIQIMIDAGYIDCYRRLNTNLGFTFPAWDPHVRLDYVFTPAGFVDRVTSCEVVTDISEPAKATDHMPLVAKIATH